jgi:flavin-dependent dehydrogenase
VEVVTPQHTYRADLVIGADGVGSRVRRFLYGELGLDREPVTRLYQADVEQPFRPDEAEAMTFDFSVLEAGIHGYFWTFPSLRCDGSAERPVMNTGLMHLPPYGEADPKAVLRTTLRHYDYADADSVALHAYPELAYRRDRPIGSANVLLVGDAAGIEPLSGEGLAQCVSYGRLAAAFAQRQWRRRSTDYTRFTRFVAKSTVGREMHMATRLAKRLYGPNWRFWLGLFVSRPWIGRLLARQSEGRDYLHRHLPRLHLTYLGYRLFGRRLVD